MLTKSHTQPDRLAHTFEVQQVGEVVVVQVWLHVGVGGGEPQLSGTHGKLKAGAEAYVVAVVVDLDLSGSMFAGHQEWSYLHVVANARALDRVAESHLNSRLVNVGALSGSVEQNTG